jgi:hypothetical protein
MTADMFFEGGLPEYVETSANLFEGGDEDDFFAVAEAEESARLSGKKKKKKKGGPLKSGAPTGGLPNLAAAQARGVGDNMKIYEPEIDDGASAKRSTRSKSKDKRRPGSKSRENNESSKFLDESMSQMNGTNYGSSKPKKKKKKKRSASKAN